MNITKQDLANEAKNILRMHEDDTLTLRELLNDISISQHYSHIGTTRMAFLMLAYIEQEDEL